MALWVQKFGGTSVADPQRISAAAQWVLKARDAGHQVIVVVSAMAHETDRLLALAQQLSSVQSSGDHDALLATGEQVTASLFSMCLNKLGCPAQAYHAGQITIETSGNPGEHKISHIQTQVLKEALAAGQVPVVAGFQGVSAQGRFTTLGRGGSDVTAVALAAAMKAERCDIYTDVEGIYTADPRCVPQAIRLNEVACPVALELAQLGSKVIQHRAVSFAGKYRVPVRILSSFKRGPGTLIVHEQSDMEAPHVTGIASDTNQARVALLGMPERLGLASYILSPLSARGIDVDMIIQSSPNVQSVVDFSCTIARHHFNEVKQIFTGLQSELGAQQIQLEQHLAKVSLVGSGIRTHAGIAAKMFSILGQQGIHVHMVHSADIKVSALIHEQHMPQAVQALHQGFNLGRVN